RGPDRGRHRRVQHPEIAGRRHRRGDLRRGAQPDGPAGHRRRPPRGRLHRDLGGMRRVLCVRVGDRSGPSPRCRPDPGTPAGLAGGAPAGDHRFHRRLGRRGAAPYPAGSGHKRAGASSGSRRRPNPASMAVMTNTGSAAPGRLPSELAPLEAGDPENIGPFRVVGRLGAGGMGAVYGALDGAGRCIAVKVVHERFAADPRFRSAFAREVALMRRVGGVCTASVLDADPTAARPWVATGFVPGRTLARHVREHGPLGGEVLHAFAAGTAEALAAVHAAGVVHCDVKPANVMLAPDGPRLLDFGIARPVAETGGDGVFGSPGWMSPERIAGRDPVPADDVFAWGGLVAFAATGRPPYGRGDTDELLRRTREEPPDLTGVPEDLLPLVRAAFDRDPGARPPAEEAFRAV